MPMSLPPMSLLEGQASTLLSVEQVDVWIGGVQVLWSVGFAVDVGSVTALLGSNGSGKSTVLGAISGVRRIARGQVRFDGGAVTSRTPRERVKLGIGHVLERQHVFADMSVRENLEVGGYTLDNWSSVGAQIEKVVTLFPRLKQVMKNNANSLSGGEQAMLVIGRALMRTPRLLLLDEPFLGIAPALVEELSSHMAQLKEQGITMIVVDQNVERALRLSDSCVVLSGGRVVFDGSSDEPGLEKKIREVYLPSGST